MSNSLQPCGLQHPGFLVHQQFPGLTQIHFDRVGDAIQPSHQGSAQLQGPAVTAGSEQRPLEWYDMEASVGDPPFTWLPPALPSGLSEGITSSKDRGSSWELSWCPRVDSPVYSGCLCTCPCSVTHPSSRKGGLPPSCSLLVAAELGTVPGME